MHDVTPKNKGMYGLNQARTDIYKCKLKDKHNAGITIKTASYAKYISKCHK